MGRFLSFHPVHCSANRNIVKIQKKLVIIYANKNEISEVNPLWLSQHVLKDPTGADDDQWSEETREECEGGKGHKGRTTAQTTHNGGKIISKGATGKITFVAVKILQSCLFNSWKSSVKFKVHLWHKKIGSFLEIFLAFLEYLNFIFQPLSLSNTLSF